MEAPRAVILALPLLATLAAPAPAAPPEAATVVARMKAALEPERTSTRRMTVVVSAEEGEATPWTAGQAREKLETGSWMVIAMLAPESVRGVTFLVREAADGTGEEWVYLPTVGRVRKIVPVDRHQAFLNSDFTYFDLGFVSRQLTYKLLGTETRDGVLAYKLEEVPRERWRYARILTWVAADSYLPLRREYYDPANVLWKVERFENVTTIDGVPTPLKIRMEDVQTGGNSEILVSDVRYGADVPDTLFAPEKLPKAAGSSFWQDSGQ